MSREALESLYCLSVHRSLLSPHISFISFLSLSYPFCSLLHLSCHLPFLSSSRPPPSFSWVIIYSCWSQVSVLQQEEDNTSSGSLTRSQRREMEGGGSKGGKKGGRKEEVEWGQSIEGRRGRERRWQEGQDEQSVREKRRKNSVYWICNSQAVTYRPYYLLTQPFNHVFCKTGVIYKPSSAYRLSVLHTAQEKESAGEAKHWIVYTFIYLLVWTVVNMENTERPCKRCNINKNDSCWAPETLIAFKVRKMYRWSWTNSKPHDKKLHFTAVGFTEIWRSFIFYSVYMWKRRK